MSLACGEVLSIKYLYHTLVVPVCSFFTLHSRYQRMDMSIKAKQERFHEKPAI